MQLDVGQDSDNGGIDRNFVDIEEKPDIKDASGKQETENIDKEDDTPVIVTKEGGVAYDD